MNLSIIPGCSVLNQGLWLYKTKHYCKSDISVTLLFLLFFENFPKTSVGHLNTQIDVRWEFDGQFDTKIKAVVS